MERIDCWAVTAISICIQLFEFQSPPSASSIHFSGSLFASLICINGGNGDFLENGESFYARLCVGLPSGPGQPCAPDGFLPARAVDFLRAQGGRRIVSGRNEG